MNTHTDGRSLPWTTSWHPYFKVSDVSQARLKFDSGWNRTAGGGPAWNHIVCGPGAPRNGDLIPTGRSEPWGAFDGKHPIGGTPERPTYFDDEFFTTSPSPPPLPCPEIPGQFLTNPKGIDQSIIDGNESIILRAPGAHTPFRSWQLFTGAKEGWGWDAIAMEPMSALADAYNNGDGLRVLAAGESFEGTFGVTQR